jgi:hypothetical protein
MALRSLPPIWASKSKDDSEVVGHNSVSFRRYGVKRVSLVPWGECVTQGPSRPPDLAHFSRKR